MTFCTMPEIACARPGGNAPAPAAALVVITLTSGTLPPVEVGRNESLPRWPLGVLVTECEVLVVEVEVVSCSCRSV